MLVDAIVLLGVASVTFGSSDSFLFSSYLLRELLRETCLYSLVTVCSHLTMLILQLLGPVRVFPSPFEKEILMEYVIAYAESCSDPGSYDVRCDGPRGIIDWRLPMSWIESHRLLYLGWCYPSQSLQCQINTADGSWTISQSIR